jgi:hypothetical protein
VDHFRTEHGAAIIQIISETEEKEKKEKKKPRTIQAA